jgi:hypothetical protein
MRVGEVGMSSRTAQYIHKNSASLDRSPEKIQKKEGRGEQVTIRFRENADAQSRERRGTRPL